MGCLGNFDVKLPTLADFESPDMSAKIFISTSPLCLIMAEIQTLSLRRQRIDVEEVAALLISLRSWLISLPDDLQLYTSEVRKSYHLPVLQLHLLYLASFIWLSLLPGRHRQSRVLCTSAFVAASCIARLYDDILSHDDVHRLLPHHGWISIVAAVPQIYFITKFPGRESASVEELDILTSVVSQLSTKYASASMVLRKITAFRRQRSNLPRMVSADDGQDLALNLPQLSALDEELFKGIEELFPFPDSHCSSIKLLRCATEGSDDGACLFAPQFGLQDMDFNLDWSMMAFDGRGGLLDMPGIDFASWDEDTPGQ